MIDPEHAFGGATYEARRDYLRLSGQLLRTWQVMLDGRERTLTMIAREASAKRVDGGRDSEAAISARLRDFRKDKFGGHALVARNGGGGLWWYRLIVTRKMTVPIILAAAREGECRHLVLVPGKWTRCGRPTVSGGSRCDQHTIRRY